MIGFLQWVVDFYKVDYQLVLIGWSLNDWFNISFRESKNCNLVLVGLSWWLPWWQTLGGKVSAYNVGDLGWEDPLEKEMENPMGRGAW